MEHIKLLEKYWYLVVAGIVAVVYGTTFLNQWTYDDIYVVVNNPDTLSLSEFMKNSYPGRPLRELTHIIERYFFGTKPGGYHILQLLLHTFNGMILYIFMVRAGLKSLPALLGTLFFLLHPLQSESVANIAHRKELLGFFGAFLSIISYQESLYFQDKKRHLFILLSIILFIIGMAGNETVITIPVVWVAYEYLLVPRNERYLFRFPRVLTIASLVACVSSLFWLIPYFTYQNIQAVYLKNNYEPLERMLPHIMGVFTAFALYWQKLVYPRYLAPEYVIPLADSYSQPLAWCGIIILIGLLSVAYLCRNSSPLIAFGVCYFLLLYLPVSNIIPVAYSMADRYMYIPLGGIAIVISYIANRMWSTSLISMFVLCLSILATFTFVQNQYWRNEFTLWEHSVTVNPLSSPVQESAAQAAMLNGQLTLAHTRALEAVRLNKLNVRAYFTLAMIEEIMGDKKSASENYLLFIGHGKDKYPELVEVAREKLDAMTR